MNSGEGGRLAQAGFAKVLRGDLGAVGHGAAGAAGWSGAGEGVDASRAETVGRMAGRQGLLAKEADCRQEELQQLVQFTA
jgi:hypothetical protein